MTMSARLPVAIAVLVVFAVASGASVPFTPGMKTIGTAIKGGTLQAGTEYTLFDHNGTGVITEQWFTGATAMNDDTRIRIYVDGETAANVSLDFNLFFAHSVGTNRTVEEPNTPWASTRIAHTADGSIYNTIRIPFGSRIVITAEHPVGGSFWYIVRGVENYPMILGDLSLPGSARLKLHKLENLVTQPLDFVPVVNISSGTGGALSYLTVRGISPDYNYMEACFRAYIDGNDTPQFLSSGTEDMFLSSYYFKTGLFHEENSGCTAKMNGYSPPDAPVGPPDYQNYFLGKQNASCTEACSALGRTCDTTMNLGPNDGRDMVAYLKINCDFDTRHWWAGDQPGYVSGKTGPGGEPEPNYQKCVGFVAAPHQYTCDASYVSMQRVCHCAPPGPAPPPAPANLYTLMTAYKMFEQDPVLFNDGLKLVWRNWEEINGTQTACPTAWPPNAGQHSLPAIEAAIANQGHRAAPQPGSNVAFANYTTYAWVYEW